MDSCSIRTPCLEVTSPLMDLKPQDYTISKYAERLWWTKAQYFRIVAFRPWSNLGHYNMGQCQCNCRNKILCQRHKQDPIRFTSAERMLTNQSLTHCSHSKQVNWLSSFASRLMSPMASLVERRSFLRAPTRHLRSRNILINGLRFLWIIVIIWCEVGTFFWAISRCRWPDKSLSMVRIFSENHLVIFTSDTTTGGISWKTTARHANRWCANPSSVVRLVVAGTCA
jgi:hypothetical protein